MTKIAFIEDSGRGYVKPVRANLGGGSEPHILLLADLSEARQGCEATAELWTKGALNL